MTILGLDFDNTLVNYDDLFYDIAREKKLIGEKTPRDKIIIRDILRANSLEEEFTKIQGEVYGRRIEEARPTNDMLRNLVSLKERGLELTIISHKTRYPYKGPKYDLHKSALRWMEKNNFFDVNGLGIQKEDVHFEETKEQKVGKIIELGCTYFVDDLEDIIIKMIPRNIKTYLYNEKEVHKNSKNWNNIAKDIKSELETG